MIGHPGKGKTEWVVPRTAEEVTNTLVAKSEEQMKRIIKAVKDLPFGDQLILMKLLVRDDPRRIMTRAAQKWATKYSKDVRAYEKIWLGLGELNGR